MTPGPFPKPPDWKMFDRDQAGNHKWGLNPKPWEPVKPKERPIEVSEVAAENIRRAFQ